MKPRYLSLILLVLTLAIGLPAHAQATNLLQNPGFDSETYTLISTDPTDPATTFNAPLGWWGGIAFAPHDAFWMNVHPNGFPHSASFKRSGIFSYHMGRGGATFTAYLYQQVSVAPNSDVQGGAWAFLENSGSSITRVGIDPRGGTDPFSPNVVWSPFAVGLYQWNYMSVNAKASGAVVTLFLYATQVQPYNPNGVYWDEAFLNGIPGQSTVSTSTTSNPASNAQVVSASVRINVRSGPGTTFARIGRMNPGDAFALLEQTGDWVKIDFQGQVGFVAARFVTVSGGQPTVTSVAAPPADALDFTLDYTVRLRSAPDTNSETLARIPFKTVIQAVGRSADNAWLQVIFNGQTGWVAARFGRLSDDINRLPIR